MPQPLVRTTSLRVSAQHSEPAVRVIPEETPVALVYNGTTHAVMMATPADLEDFALGFSLAENVIGSIQELHAIEVVEQTNGIELRMWLRPHAAHRLADRRRAITGPAACGLCGVQSLAAALPALPRVHATTPLSPWDVAAAVASARPAQILNRDARGLHAAGLWVPGQGLTLLREDVGRHNALDKLAGAVSRAGHDPSRAVVVLTSRVSVEMVHKAAVLGAPVIGAMSAPTALALRAAEAAGITLIGIARDDGFEIFTHPWRLDLVS